MPTQENPTCSWAKAVPENSDTICAQAFRTIHTLVQAEIQGNNAPVYHLVTNRRVARRIIAFGAKVRSERIRQFHAIPSITLDQPVPGVIGASFDLRGKTTIGGKLKATETVYMHIRHGTAYVFDDDPIGKEW